jgi:hypothetical protein
LNHPDGGVVFNNAMTTADAGHIDRMQRVLDELAARAQRFRCCFDVWGDDHPGEEGELMLIITLSPAGEALEVRVDDERTTIEDQMAQACAMDAASRPGYPTSPTGNTTIVEYPFRVAAGTR